MPPRIKKRLGFLDTGGGSNGGRISI